MGIEKDKKQLQRIIVNPSMEHVITFFSFVLWWRVSRSLHKLKIKYIIFIIFGVIRDIITFNTNSLETNVAVKVSLMTSVIIVYMTIYMKVNMYKIYKLT
jgi:hypothetical protein